MSTTLNLDGDKKKRKRNPKARKGLHKKRKKRNVVKLPRVELKVLILSRKRFSNPNGHLGCVQLLDLDYRLLLRRKQELKKGIEFSAPEQYYGADFREKSVR